MSIINLKFDVTTKDLGYEELKRVMKQGPNAVYVGVFANESKTGKVTTQLLKKINLVMIATIQEFGAFIHHPGGTDWGYASKAAALLNSIRFLRKGRGFAVFGQTPPHIIHIPARPFIRSTITEKSGEILALAGKLLGEVITGRMNKRSMLNLIGTFIQSKIKLKIQSNVPPPNAPSTIRKKKSSHTLIDTGRMLNSITWVVRDK